MDDFKANLKTSAFGLIFAILTLLFGQGLGIVFGVNEDGIKQRLNTSAVEVKDTVYNSDETLIKPVLDKSWTYMKRAHLHSGGMGTTAVTLIILLCLVSSSQKVLVLNSLALGFGGFGYSLFWMWAGFRAPSLGGTSAAKESLNWLAVPSSGMFVFATLVVLIVTLSFVFQKKPN